jgi:antitoxin component YwqK of YwqJK toxin-antitoxin module
LWEFSITNGAFNGKAVGWGDGGRKEMQGNYVDGVPFGVWTTWDGAGNKKEEYRTRGSTRSGFAVEWHSNGVLSSVTWVDGEKRVHVPCVTWSEEGIRLYENDVEVKEKERERSNQGARGGRGTRPASNE